MKKIPKKKQHIIDAASPLFMKYGIKKVSIEEICTEAEVSKMTFYKYFENKTKLVLYLLNQIFDAAWHDFNHVMLQNISFPEKMKLHIQHKNDFAKNVSKEFFQDIYLSNETEIQDFLRINIEKSMLEIREIFTAAQKTGEIRADLNIDFLIYFLNKIQEMVSDKTLLEMHADVSDLTNNLVNMIFYGIMKKF
ncbi:MAG TPA: hypothetical protein DCQ31_19365 [Bacteroidales bacterium]|nr:hypothetical protein [Bacteroidales bacterium]